MRKCKFLSAREEFRRSESASHHRLLNQRMALEKEQQIGVPLAGTGNKRLLAARWMSPDRRFEDSVSDVTGSAGLRIRRMMR